jgi:hypothetical protein
MDDPIAEEAARLELLRLFRPALPEDLSEASALSELLSQRVPLGILTDVVAYALNFPAGIKQNLLSQNRVEARYQILVEQLSHWPPSNKSPAGNQEQPARSTNGQVPPFSAN